MTAAPAAPDKFWGKFKFEWSRDACWLRLGKRFGIAPAICRDLFIACWTDQQQTDRGPEAVLAEYAFDQDLSETMVGQIVNAIAATAGEIGEIVASWLRRWRRVLDHRRAQARCDRRKRRDRRQLEMLFAISGDQKPSAPRSAPPPNPGNPRASPGDPRSDVISTHQHQRSEPVSKPLETAESLALAAPSREELELQEREYVKAAPDARPASAPLSKQSRQEIKGEFEALWLKYPLRDKRQRAFNAYAAARHRGVPATVIADGLARYIATKPDWQQWVHLSRWLADSRWDDAGLVQPPRPTPNVAPLDEAKERALDEFAAWVKDRRLGHFDRASFARLAVAEIAAVRAKWEAAA